MKQFAQPQATAPNTAKGFAVSWFFAPYLGSADMDIFKRIKNVGFDFDVVQVARKERDEGVLKYIKNNITRYEIVTNHNQPRSVSARNDFLNQSLSIFNNNKENYDFILSHSNEMISHQVALEIKGKYPKIPWVAYFGDLFAQNPYLKYMPNHPLIDIDSKIEADTIKQADLIILNNEYQKKLMINSNLTEYQDKIIIIPHCYDPEMYPEASTLQKNSKFTIAHLGKLYHTKRTAELLLKAVDRLIDIYPKYKNKFEIVFYGSSPSPSDITTHAFMRNHNHVKFEETIPYLDSLKIASNVDALLLIDGIFDKENDQLDENPFFPGKLADYMGAKRPIIGITMTKGATADILKKSNNLIADNKIDRIAYVLKRYIDKKILPNYSYYEEYSINKTTKMMLGAFNTILKG